MAADSKIQWTHHTFNPWIGCQRVSPGCENCYAEAYDKRVGGVPKSQRTTIGAQLRWGPKAPRTRTSLSYWKQPLEWNAAARAAGERHRVFCASLADVFEDRPELVPWREELFGLIASTPRLDWLLLTKRPENIARLWPEYVREPGADGVLPCWPPGRAMVGTPREHEPWPNVWLGTTVEDQQRANERVPKLIKVPAVVHFLSCEPLLEAVNLDEWLDEDRLGFLNSPIDWVIIGGESGPGARPFDMAWARSLIQQCRDGGRSVEPKPFMKQLGSNPHGEWGPGSPPTHHLIDITVSPRRESTELSRAKNGRWKLNDRSGGTPSQWPLDLRVREFPEVPRG